MDLDPRLLELLACPCPVHADLDVVEGGLQCQHCRSVFPVRDGIPVMLLDEAEPGPHGFGVAVES